MWEDLAQEVFNWFLGGFGLASVISIILFVLLIIGVIKIAERYLVQALLLLMVWLPANVVSGAIDLTGVTPLVPLKGTSLILFPYVWDILFGTFNNPVYLIMIMLSYVSLLHLALMYVHKTQKPVYWAPLYAYFFILALGLGMVNFHKYLFDSYVSLCYTQGIHPVIPILFFVILMFLLIIFTYRDKIFRKSEGVNV